MRLTSLHISAPSSILRNRTQIPPHPSPLPVDAVRYSITFHPIPFQPCRAVSDLIRMASRRHVIVQPSTQPPSVLIAPPVVVAPTSGFQPSQIPPLVSPSRPLRGHELGAERHVSPIRVIRARPPCLDKVSMISKRTV